MSINFLRYKFEEFFVEYHPDFVCSFKSKEKFHQWLSEYSDNALDYFENLVNLKYSNIMAEELTKDEFLREFKFSPYHHFLSLFEENFPDVYEYLNESQYFTFTFLSFYFLCEKVFDKYPKGSSFVYSDEMDDEIINILSKRLKKLKLI